jgi:ribosomal protein L7Ae-like RNA K-turn-binding protein
MSIPRELSMLSIAAKAGKVASGGFLCEKAIAEGHAYFVIIARDASDNTKKKFRNKCSFYKVDCTEYGSSDELGRCIGKEARTVIAITDAGLSEQVKKKLPGMDR